MSSLSLPSDNTSGLSGSIHQLYVALEQCFEMDGEDQRVMIEKLGDITKFSSDGNIQTEVKSYQEEDALTDSHSNFWNTLKNWIHEDFEISGMKACVLHTTQSIGPKSQLGVWNEGSIEERLSILEAIAFAAEERFESSVANNQSAPVPSSLKLMRHVLSEDKRGKLIQVVGILYIAAQMPCLQDCYVRLVAKHGKGVPQHPPGNAEGYVGALLEFIIRPEKIAQQWTISYADFASAMVQFGSRFGLGRRSFPTKRAVAFPELGEEENDLYGSRFVEKIKEIDFLDKIPRAIADYTYAHSVWLEEFSRHQCLLSDYNIFYGDLHQSVSSAHESASMGCGDVLTDSKKFYLRMTGGELPIPSFPNMDIPNIGYRNGVIHTLMENESELRWKLRP